jgi:hypothetical protein
MSDISIRFDGLALLAVLALSVVGYLLVALSALATRRRRTARLAALMSVGTLTLAGAFFLWWIDQGTGHSGPDFVDALVFPWVAVFLAGCWQLTRSGRD